MVNSIRYTYGSDGQLKMKIIAPAGVTAGHYIFTTESPAEVDQVLAAYQKGTPLQGAVRRI